MESSLEDYGYEDDRFENTVSPNFHCPICLNVLKEPKMCRRNEHVFCSPCIIRHLANSSTCPQCMEELTVKTLRRPPRVFMNCLFELSINCDYFSRGCRQFVQLGDLNTHVMNCRFAPVRFSKDGHAVGINKRDRIRQDIEVCEFKKVECRDCGKMRKEIDELRMNLKAVRDELPFIKEEIVNEVRAMVDEVKHELRPAMGLSRVEPRIQETKREDIVIAVGYNNISNVSSSVETFSWEKRGWTLLPQMKQSRARAASVVHESRIIVVGGQADLRPTDNMETMRFDEEPLHWVQFPAKLPGKYSGHNTVVYQNSLIVIGGYGGVTSGETSNAIHEVLLIPPYSTKLLCRMPRPIQYPGSQLLNDKILILGGKTSNESKDSVDCAILYDIRRNQFIHTASLPYAVWGMATVRWGKKVIAVGGRDKNDKVLNDVFMYDIETQERKMLPPMKHKRSGCSATITGSVIVVMGGWNKKHGYLNSVEYFDLYLGRNSWKELPQMIERRCWATAVVKPAVWR